METGPLPKGWKGTGWVSKAAVLPLVAVAWLSPVPGGGLEQMGNPTVSPQVGCPPYSCDSSSSTSSEAFFTFQVGIS